MNLTDRRPCTPEVNRWQYNLNSTGLDSATYIIDIFFLSGERSGRGVFSPDVNPGRICRILTAPVTPAMTSAKNTLRKIRGIPTNSLRQKGFSFLTSDDV